MPRSNSLTVSFDVPPGWGSIPTADGVMIGAPARHGFQPNIVVRESRTTATLPDLAQANALATLHDIEDAYVCSVTAATSNHLHRRRIVALTPTVLQNTPICLETVQDLMIVDGVAVEATATTPLLFGAELRDDLREVLDSVAVLPATWRRQPPLRSELPAARLDAQASAAAGCPLEELNVLHGVQRFAINDSQRRISPGALAELERVIGAGRLFVPRVVAGTIEFDILRAAALIEGDGTLAAAGRRVADLQRHGRAWTIERDRGDKHRRMRCWTHDGATLVIADPTPEDDEHGWDDVIRIGIVGPDELIRIVHAWTDLSPAWPTADSLAPQPLARLLNKVTGRSRLPDESAPLAAAAWEYFVVSVAEVPDENVAWMWADGLGPALLQPDRDLYVVTRAETDDVAQRIFTFLGTHLPLHETDEYEELR